MHNSRSCQISWFLVVTHHTVGTFGWLMYAIYSHLLWLLPHFGRSTLSHGKNHQRNFCRSHDQNTRSLLGGSWSWWGRLGKFFAHCHSYDSRGNYSFQFIFSPVIFSFQITVQTHFDRLKFHDGFFLAWRRHFFNFHFFFGWFFDPHFVVTFLSGHCDRLIAKWESCLYPFPPNERLPELNSTGSRIFIKNYNAWWNTFDRNMRWFANSVKDFIVRHEQ